MDTVTILTVDPDPKFRAQADAHLRNHPGFIEAEDLEEADRFLRENENIATVLLLGPTLPPKPALSFAQDVQERAPGISIVLVAPKLTSPLLQSALRAGVRDVLPTSCTAKQFRDAVQRAETLSAQLTRGHGGGTSEQPRGKLITVFSPKGGCGKSVVASNLALLLAERTGEDVALVDLDLESGDLAIMLHMSPERTIYDAAQNLDLLDAEALRGYLNPYGSGLSLLAAPPEPGLAEKVSPAAVRRILGMLRETHAYVVVDGPSFFTEHVLTALDESDECILMASLDVPSVKNLKMALKTFEILGFRSERLRLVLNRADSKVGLAVDEVEKTLKTKIEMLIPSSRDVPLCVNRGVPVAQGASRSGVTTAITKLADAIRGAADTPERAPRRFSLTRR